MAFFNFLAVCILPFYGSTNFALLQWELLHQHGNQLFKINTFLAEKCIQAGPFPLFSFLFNYAHSAAFLKIEIRYTDLPLK